MLPGVRSGVLSSNGISSVTCLLCQWRTFTTSTLRWAEKSPVSKPVSKNPPVEAGTPEGRSDPLANAPRSYGERTEEFTPTPLSRPIGMPNPPQPGENMGIDRRTLRQRRDDLANRDKLLARREELKKNFAKPYFREWNNLQFHKGKTFLAPPRLFKGELSLFFPNLHGRTLLKSDRKGKDTTPVLQGKASVVAMFSNLWAENQVNTFVSEKDNPALHEVLGNSIDKAQLIRINVEENSFKAWLIRLFMGSLRRRIGKPNWDKYFIVRRGISDEIRESIGLLNSKVGYVYLVDQNCKIRWAGSGLGEPDEREALAKGVQRLLQEMSKNMPQKQAAVLQKVPISRESS